MNSLIAFAGYAGAGKDEATRALLALGYERRCFGDLIKRQLDGVVRHHFGFSALTEDRAQKKMIRRTLEAWGDDNYDSLMREFFQLLPRRCVNTRLVRAREAAEWRARGGIIVRVERPGTGPATDWERAQMEELRPLVTHHLANDAGIAELHERARQLAGE